MAYNLEININELKKVLERAKNGDYPKDDSRRELQTAINLASMDIMFNYSRHFKNSQREFEDSFDVIKSSIELLRGSTFCESQIERARDLVEFAVKQEDPKLKIPYRCVEYLPGYIII